MDSGFTLIQDTMINKTDYLELGLVCADVCKALQRGMNGRGMDDLGQSAREAITQLTTWVEPVTDGLGSSLMHALDRRTIAEIQDKIDEKGGRNIPSRLVHAGSDKDVIATWKSDLTRILQVFTVRSVTLCFIVANCSNSGRVGLEYSYDDFGSPSWCADGSGGC